jgi:hypothetical protein
MIPKKHLKSAGYDYSYYNCIIQRAYFEETLPLYKKRRDYYAEIIMQDNPNQSKALIFSINHPNIRLLMVRREVIYPLMYVVVLQIVGS